MKKLISLCICVIMLVSFASCGKTTDPEKYIPDAQYVSLALMVDANQYFCNEVFVSGHLKIDESKTVEKDGSKYALVTDSTYTTMKSLKDTLSSTYTDDVVSNILNEYNYYTEIDGKLYYNLSSESKITEGSKWTRITGEKVDVVEKNADILTIEYKFTSKNEKISNEFTFVQTDGAYKLSEFKKVG